LPELATASYRVDVPRAIRVRSPTGLYHVTSRAIRPLHLFADAADCMVFGHGLARIHAEDGLRVYAYCLMGTHFHLIVGAEPDVLGRSMRRLKGWYAYELNARRNRAGPVFDGRYEARALATETHVWAAVVYVAVNPVRAGLKPHPDLWPYGSHRAHAGLEGRPPWLAPVDELGLFQHSGSYREAVDEAVLRIGGSAPSGQA
jgi:putative transposase